MISAVMIGGHLLDIPVLQRLNCIAGLSCPTYSGDANFGGPPVTVAFLRSCRGHTHPTDSVASQFLPMTALLRIIPMTSWCLRRKVVPGKNSGETPHHGEFDGK